MLLNTWLSAARRHFNSGTSARRVARAGSRSSGSAESLETRSLLTALVITPETRSLFLNASGGIEVTNADMVGKDSLVIEGFSISATSGDAISINLSGITLNSLAIESINVTQYSSLGFDIDLTNVTGLHTIAIEDVRLTGAGRGLDLRLSNTDVDAVTIDDSTIPGVRIDAVNTSVIGEGLITESTIAGGTGIEGVLLNVSSATADNFRISDNPRITSVNRDFLRINATNSPMDGLAIENNQIGTVTQGAGLIFRAEGDTFAQEMILTNDSTQGEWLQTFVLDLSSIGREFDTNPVTGKPFTFAPGSNTTTGLVSSVVSTDRSTLTLTFSDFAPGESIPFVIDIDRAGGQAAAVFGDDLIGADVSTIFENTPRSSTRTVAGQMIGDPNRVTASEFATGPNTSGTTQGIVLNLQNAPSTNVVVAGNTVLGSPGHAFLIDANGFSDITGVIRDNDFTGAGRDGIRFDMEDSNFTGAVIDNRIQGNGGHGIAVLPVVSRSGQVETLLDASTVVVTSTNHGLQTGDVIMIQGLVNDDPTVNHPGNGLRTITRIDNHRFQLNGVNGTAAGVRYVGGGTWYVPDFQPDGTARGLVTVDMQTSVPSGIVRTATNAGPIVITSPNHGLTSGQRIRISNVAGNTNANGVRKITVINANSFSLDGVTGNGAYNTSAGFGSWTANVITGAANSANLVITSPGHGLQTGEQIRVTGVLGNTAANGTFTVTRVTADTFRLNGKTGNGVYAGGGNWVRLNETTSTGDRLPQRISGNLITSNRQAGLFVDVTTGTVFNGDIVGNTFQANEQSGVHIESHSFGLGTDLPLNPAQPFALPGSQDIGYNVSIGTNAAGDGNVFQSNVRAGIQLEALDYGTASFRILNNTIAETQNDADPETTGDGIFVQLTNDLSATEAISFFSESIIDGNNIGVDNGGNEGHGLLFRMEQRTRIQDLILTNTVFLNNSLDGFHFERSEDADLNSLVIEKNRSTNNSGDGFDIFAKNTVKDELDFRINENVIDQNAQYGVRVRLEADVRAAFEFNQNSVIGNGHTPGGQGFHPNDGVTGSTRSAGGVGILAFEEIGVRWNMTDTQINNNIGDGFSIDAFNHDDTLITHFDATNSTFNNNSLTGLRNHGTSFGSFDFVGSQFNDNGEDGVRMVSIEDKNDSFFRRRVGGRDVDVTGLDNEFMLNTQSGVQLGQGYSASFGDGTVGNANYFSNNGEDGLKLTQHNSPHADRLGLRRTIQTNRNFFQNNLGDGIDIGHDRAQENGNAGQGNVEHGDEVASDINVIVNNAIISGNRGDGVEYLADPRLRINRVIGGGQDISFLARSSLTVSNSRVAQNDGRGIDILNRGYDNNGYRSGQDSYIALINNDILSNRLEGIYVMNSASPAQLQRNSADVLEVDVLSAGGQILGQAGGQIEIRIQDNLIESNGNAVSTSRVPIELSAGFNDRTGNPFNGTQNGAGEAVSDWVPATEQIPGTLGGLVIRVGTVDSVGRLITANAGLELGQNGIDAEVWKNSFDGNFGPDVYFDTFVSGMAPWTQGNFHDPLVPPFSWNVGYRDPLSRFDLSFRENTGNGLDVMNGFSYQDNWESYYKSRHFVQSTAPDPAINPLSQVGDWVNPGRKRNMTRTIGRYTDSMGDVPGGEAISPAPGGFWAYDGMGTSTWRVETDFDFSSFPQTSSTDGFSNFFTEVNLNTENQQPYQWDTGIDTGNFVGQTPFSLNRGDIFNVRAGESPIVADQLDDNNAFASAFDLGSIAGASNSVNARTTNGNLNLHVKGDRDYYRFTAAGTGALDVDLNSLDGLGDTLRYMIYEVTPTLRSEEVAMFRTPALLPAYFTVIPGGNNTISTNVVAGREYIIEILSDESSSTGFSTNGKPFGFGTTRRYSLTIDAPAAASGGSSSSAAGSGSSSSSSGSSAGSGAATGSESGGSGSGSNGGNIPGARPTAAFVAVSPDPRLTSAGTLTLNFTEDVTGVDIADFRLTRNGVNVPLTSNLLTRVNAMRYTLNVGSLTGNSGTYVVTLNATNSGIRDTDNVALSTNATDTWVVSNFISSAVDTPDVNPGDGVARDSSGRVTLRAAVMESNASVGSDVILLGSRSYTLSRTGRFEDDSFTGDLDIRGNLTIRGTGAASTIINGNDLDRIFHVFPGATLTLIGLTITGGEAFDGGGFFNRGSVILENVNVIRNEAYNQGGGVFNNSGAVFRATGSSLSQNLAGSRGGAVNNLGTTIYISTTISANTAVSRGGGIFNEGNGTASLSNVTIARNFAASRGGGLASESNTTSRVSNSVLEGNLTDSRVPATNATINKDIMSGITSLGFNLIQTLDQRFATGASSGLLTSDTFGRDATPLPSVLNALTSTAGNGVWAHTLRPTSAAVDGGSNALYPTTPLLNQRDGIGNPRLIEGDRDGVITIDVGAVEHLVNTPVAIFVATPNPAGLNELITFNGTSSTHPNPATGRIVKWEWDFDYNSALGFRPDRVGATVTNRYADPARTSYIVRLVVTDNFGNTGFIDRVVLVGAPTQPVVERPFVVTTDRTPLIRWTASPATYELLVYNVSTGSRVLAINQRNLTTTSFTPTSDLPSGRYEVVVIARNQGNVNGTASESFFFRVAAMNPIAPKGETFDVTPRFTWGAIGDTSRYELWIRQTQPTVTSTLFRDAFISGTTFEPTTSLGLGTFAWWVRAYDSDGVAGAWSATSTFSIGRPTMTRPLDVTVDTTPTFSWTDMDPKPVGQKDTRYELWVNQVGGQVKILHETSLSTTSFTPSTPLPNGSYNAWVRPIAPDGEAGLWSPVRRFTMDFRVGPVTYSPSGVTTDNTPTFTWQAADSATSYDLWVDNLSTGVNEVIRVSVPHVQNADRITYTHPTLLNAGNYRWWVQTVSSSGVKTSFSAGTNFNVPVPTIVNPRGAIATNLPLFTWNGVPEYVSYELWVDNTGTGTSQVLRVAGLTTRFFQTTLPLENGDFRAWVRGTDAAGNVSQWSGPADFNVTVGVGTAPTLNFAFTNGNNIPTFSWDAGGNEVAYEIIVKRISDASQPTVINVRGIVGTTYTHTSALTPGIYRWWIRGLDSTGNGLPWSAPDDFFVFSNGDSIQPGHVSEAMLTQVIPVVLNAESLDWSADSVQSITAHPAGMIVQVEPAAVETLTAVQSAQTNLPVQHAVEIDAFMEEWATDALFAPAEGMVVPAPGLPVSAKEVKVVGEREESEDDLHALNLIMSGLVAGTVIASGKRREDRP